MKNLALLSDTIDDMLKLISPFGPHFAEEMWEKKGNEYSIFNQSWPSYDEKALVKDTIEMAVQVNGVVRSRIAVASDAGEEEIRAAALADSNVGNYVAGKEIKKVIVVKNRLVNIVAK